MQHAKQSLFYDELYQTSGTARNKKRLRQIDAPKAKILTYFMKQDIHPKYYPEAKVKCACGAIFAIGSTQSELAVEICSNCHPFFTGKEKLIDTAGKVERFKARRTKAAEAPKKEKKPRVKKKKEGRVEMMKK